MDHREIKQTLRSKGLCGAVNGDRACVLPIGHDCGGHEGHWRVVEDESRALYGSTTVYRVRRERLSYIFTADSKEAADWLADILNSP